MCSYILEAKNVTSKASVLFFVNLGHLMNLLFSSLSWLLSDLWELSIKANVSWGDTRY